MKEKELIQQRIYRKRTRNAATRKYEKTQNGFLMRLYHNMKDRIAGLPNRSGKLYLGLECLPRNVFYSWAKNQSEFQYLWNNWVASGRVRRLVPTVNRKDSSIGYILSNMEWLTREENGRLGALSRWRNKK